MGCESVLHDTCISQLVDISFLKLHVVFFLNCWARIFAKLLIVLPCMFDGGVLDVLDDAHHRLVGFYTVLAACSDAAWQHLKSDGWNMNELLKTLLLVLKRNAHFTTLVWLQDVLGKATVAKRRAR